MDVRGTGERGNREDGELCEIASHLRSARLLLTAEPRPGRQAVRDEVDLALLELSLLLDGLPEPPPAPVQPGVTYHLQRAERLIRRQPRCGTTGAAELVKEALQRLGR